MPGALLKVTIDAEPTYRAGQPIQVKVRVTNASEGPLLVNARLLRNFAISPGELVFSITNESGGEHRLQLRIEPRPLGDADFVVLEPGASLEKVVDLHADYAVKEPGRYRVSVTYRNKKEWRKGDLDAWQGEVPSEAITLQVQ